MRRHLAAAVLAVSAAVAVAGCTSSSTDPPPTVQYPPGQRPCAEAEAALDQVLRLQLLYGSGPKDPDGRIVNALEYAKTPMRYLAGESPYYDAGAYDIRALNVYVTLGPLIDAYKKEDPNTPYDDNPDWFTKSSEYDSAVRAFHEECNKVK